MAENLAAHRFSHLLSRSRGILLISQKLRVRGRPRRPQRAWAFKGPSKMASRGIIAGAPCAGADRSESATSSGWPHTLGGCGDNTWRGFRARATLCRSAERCAVLNCSRISINSRNCARRSAFVRARTSSRALVRDKRFKLRLIVASERSHSLMCEPVSACRARLTSRSRSMPGGVPLASFRSFAASSARRSSSESIF